MHAELEQVLDVGPLSAVEAGRELFVEKLGCVGCHQDGLANNGPSLVGIGDLYLARFGDAEGAAIRLRAFLGDPNRVPGLIPFPSKMPDDVKPKEEDLDSLVWFLLSRTGQRAVSAAGQ